MKALFIDTTYLKENSVIENNVEDKVLLVQIQKSQDIDILQIIGTGLQNELMQKVYDKIKYDEGVTGYTDTITGTLYQTLLEDYIQPAQVEWAVWRAIPYIQNKLENSGLVNKFGENSNSVDFKRELYLRDDVKQTAEVYSNKLKNFLCENQNFFTLFANPGTGKDVVRPNFEYESGIFTDGWQGEYYSENEMINNAYNHNI